MNYILCVYIISFTMAFVISFFATPLSKKLSFKLGAVDIPKDNRRMHKLPIARLGGLAIVSGFMIAILFVMFILLFEPFNLTEFEFPRIAGLLFGIIIIFAVGIVDDIRQLGPRVKLAFQLLAAILVVATGTRIGVVTNPFSEIGLSLLNDYIAVPLTILWIVGITNAINLIDGLDGLAAGVSSIASLALFFVSVVNRQYDAAIMTAALAGSALGFLPYNFNPAKIFMGDTGSTFLGFTLAVISVQGTFKGYTAIAIAVPLLVLGLPLFDTSFAIFRRITSGKSIMAADRGHLHHKLIDMGLSHKQSVVVMYTVSSALGLCAIVLTDRGVLSALILVIAISIFIIGGARYMSDLSEIDDNPDSKDK